VNGAGGKGRFIVFEGTDGSGLTTQAELLRALLTRHGYPSRDACHTIGHPRCETHPDRGPRESA